MKSKGLTPRLRLNESRPRTRSSTPTATSAKERPLVLLQHFRGNLDNWDPALDRRARGGAPCHHLRQRGVGGTGGSTPSTVETMAHDAIAFLDAMGLDGSTCWASRSAASSRRK